MVPKACDGVKVTLPLASVELVTSESLCHLPSLSLYVIVTVTDAPATLAPRLSSTVTLGETVQRLSFLLPVDVAVGAVQAEADPDAFVVVVVGATVVVVVGATVVVVVGGGVVVVVVGGSVVVVVVVVVDPPPPAVVGTTGIVLVLMPAAVELTLVVAPSCIISAAPMVGTARRATSSEYSTRVAPRSRVDRPLSTDSGRLRRWNFIGSWIDIAMRAPYGPFDPFLGRSTHAEDDPPVTFTMPQRRENHRSTAPNHLRAVSPGPLNRRGQYDELIDRSGRPQPFDIVAREIISQSRDFRPECILSADERHAQRPDETVLSGWECPRSISFQAERMVEDLSGLPDVGASSDGPGLHPRVTDHRRQRDVPGHATITRSSTSPRAPPQGRHGS